MRSWAIGTIGGVLALLGATSAHSQAWVPPVEMAEPAPHGVRIATDRVIGNYLAAPGTGRKPAILLLGGSEGALGGGALQWAVELQAAGFSVLQLSYYRAPGQSADFSRVPIETLERGLTWLRRQPGVDPRRIGVVGGSKGAEGALILAARRRDIRAVVAGMPSAYQWAAFSWDGRDLPGASWSLDGRDVPFLPYGPFDPEVGMLSLYANGLEARAAHEDAAIAIERSPAPVLLICGEMDALWPSCAMAEMLRQRSPRVQVLAYENAGHAVFGPPLADDSTSLPMLAALGGTPEGNNSARRDSWPRMIAFLRLALGS